mgnify:CR=1 FL=1
MSRKSFCNRYLLPDRRLLLKSRYTTAVLQEEIGGLGIGLTGLSGLSRLSGLSGLSG